MSYKPVDPLTDPPRQPDELRRLNLEQDRSGAEMRPWIVARGSRWSGLSHVSRCAAALLRCTVAPLSLRSSAIRCPADHAAARRISFRRLL
jgi:hypothetical protein